jgi:hypothetical protein
MRIVAAVLSLSCLVSAALDDVDKNHQRRRDLLLRAAAENSQDSERQDDIGSSKEGGPGQEELGERLRLFQMDTSLIHANHPDHEFDTVTQPLTKPLEYGASGELTYRAFGWDFAYSFVARGLQPDASYELIYYPSSANKTALDIACIASGVVGRLVSAL